VLSIIQRMGSASGKSIKWPDYLTLKMRDPAYMPFGFSGNAPVTLSPPPRRIWIFRAVVIPRSGTGSC
jgi:hypothetical protein